MIIESAQLIKMELIGITVYNAVAGYLNISYVIVYLLVDLYVVFAYNMNM